MSPLWVEGEAIAVTATDDGRPLRFVWRGQAYKVDAVCNRWRASETWWRSEPDAWREYLKVTTRNGLLCLLARDLDAERWSLIRVYD